MTWMWLFVLYKKIKSWLNLVLQRVEHLTVPDILTLSLSMLRLTLCIVQKGRSTFKAISETVGNSALIPTYSLCNDCLWTHVVNSNRNLKSQNFWNKTIHECTDMLFMGWRKRVETPSLCWWLLHCPLAVRTEHFVHTGRTIHNVE